MRQVVEGASGVVSRGRRMLACQAEAEAQRGRGELKNAREMTASGSVLVVRLKSDGDLK